MHFISRKKVIFLVAWLLRGEGGGEGLATKKLPFFEALNSKKFDH